MRNESEKKHQVKTQILGPDKHRLQEIKIISRSVQWHGTIGLIYEVDPRHAELIIEQLGLRDSRSVTTPGTKRKMGPRMMPMRS